MYNGAKGGGGEIRRYTCVVPVCLPSCSSVRADVHAYILWAIIRRLSTELHRRAAVRSFLRDGY